MTDLLYRPGPGPDAWAKALDAAGEELGRVPWRRAGRPGRLVLRMFARLRKGRQMNQHKEISDGLF